MKTNLIHKEDIIGDNNLPDKITVIDFNKEILEIMKEKSTMKISRIWAMPSKHTFQIKPIKELLQEEMNNELWIDPFSGGSNLATETNDMNPEIQADYHLTAQAFLESYKDREVDGVLYDPPYSVRQVSECYKKFGLAVTQETTRANWWTNHKIEIARIVKPEGKVISFGWNSGGIGKKLGFEITRILLVPHGGIHNDTICVVEQKISNLLNRRK